MLRSTFPSAGTLHPKGLDTGWSPESGSDRPHDPRTRTATAVAPPASRPAGVKIRGATELDITPIMQVERLAFGASDQFTIGQIRGLLTNPRANTLVGILDGRVDAWAVTLTRRTPAGRTGRLYSLAVRPESGGRGVGRALCAHAIAALDKENVGRVYLEVRADNERAIGLYRSLGFTPFAALPGYYLTADGLRMRRLRPGPPTLSP